MTDPERLATVEAGLGPDTTREWAEEIFMNGRESMKAEVLELSVLVCDCGFCDECRVRLKIEAIEP